MMTAQDNRGANRTATEREAWLDAAGAALASSLLTYVVEAFAASFRESKLHLSGLQQAS